MLKRVFAPIGSRRAAVAGGLLLSLIAVPASTASAATPSFTAPRVSPAPVASVRTVDMSQVPSNPAAALGPPVQVPFNPVVDQATWAQQKAAAQHIPYVPGHQATKNPPAPPNPTGGPAASISISSSTAPTSAAAENFGGISESKQSSLSGRPTVPSDQGIAAGPSYNLQVVNSAITIKDTSGNLQTGFPKSLASFFGVGCSSGGPAVPFDVDAAYDAGSARYIVSAITSTYVDHCSGPSDLHLAVSQTSDPRGSWYVFDFVTSQNNTMFLDYPHIGFNANAIFWSGNDYAFTSPYQTLGAYQGIFLQGCSKAGYYSGTVTGCVAWSNLTVNGGLVDTVQPVKNVVSAGGTEPSVERLINTFRCSGSCNQIVIWSANLTTSYLTEVTITGPSYTIPPAAPNDFNAAGGCKVCINTGDTRITTAPPERNGHIYTPIDTGYNNGSQSVPGFWYVDITLSLDASGIATSNTAVTKSGILYFGGDAAGYFPAFMADSAGNVMGIYDYSDDGTAPSALYLKVADSSGNLWSSAGNWAAYSTTVYTPPAGYAACSSSSVCNWGDYSSASSDGTNSWFATQYSCGDWCTRVVEDNA